MKKVSIFTLALLLGFGIFAQDQPVLRTEMGTSPRFGIRGGVNLASLELDDDNNTTNYNTNSKTSFHAGVFVNLPLGGALRLQPELSYVGQGSKVAGTPLVGTQNTIDYELDFHYLALPIMFQLQPKGGFFVELGPQFAYLLNAKQDNSGTDNDPDIKNFIKKTDFALAGGLGYLSRVGLGLNARYVHGLTNVYNTDDAPAGTKDREVSNRGIQLGLVYHFGANR